MTPRVRAFARYCFVPLAIAAVIGGGVAVGLATMAKADPATPTTTTVPAGPGYQYYPDHYATPAPTQAPGWPSHHGPGHMN
jgi:hypothetical protein